MKVDSEIFLEALSHLSPKLKWFLTIYPKEYYEKDNIKPYLFLFKKDNKIKTGGFVLKNNRKENSVELITLFSVNGNFLKNKDIEIEETNDILENLFNKALILGANKLDCLGEKLLKVYSKKFSLIESFDFNKEYVENKESLAEYIKENLKNDEIKLKYYKCHFLKIDYTKLNDIELSQHINLFNKLGNFQDINGKIVSDIVKKNKKKYPKTIQKLRDFNIYKENKIKINEIER